MPHRPCRECGGPLPAGSRFDALFCSAPCRKAFNNRRAMRGAEMHDLVMEMRFNRDAAKAEGAWSALCAMASAYRDEDKTQRAGRQSWHSKTDRRVDGHSLRSRERAMRAQSKAQE